MSVIRPPLRKTDFHDAGARKLFLAFYLGQERYVMAASDIVAVRRFETARPVPGAPAWVCGLITHAMRPVPLIDLSARATGVASRRVTSTRIVLVTYAWPPKSSSSSNLLAVMVEQATETIHLNTAAFVDAGVHVPTARYLGPVIDTDAGFVQWIRVQDLLDDEVRACLIGACEAAVKSSEIHDGCADEANGSAASPDAAPR